MKTIKNDNLDPFYNLALEEYLLKKVDSDEDIFFLWRNRKSVVVGRNQNPFNEIDMEYAIEHNIDIVRRSTGGGTVYHDEGNINFTFVSSKISSRLHNYEFFTTPIILILNKLGIKAEFIPKTHIYVGENKVSGNAQTYYKNRMVHHGTLLFNTDLIHLHKIQHTNNSIQTVAIASEQSNVTNLKDLIAVELSTLEFMDFIMREMEINSKDVMTLTTEQENEIMNLADHKYRSWDWVFGQTPKFTIEKAEFKFEIRNGVISSCSHYQDILLRKKYERQSITEHLKKHKEKEKIISLLFN